MGMNPDTHMFEPLDSPAAFNAAQRKNWKIFKTGEKVTLNGTDFTVTDIQPTKLVLRPFGLGLSGPGEASGNYAQMPRYRSHKEVSALKIAYVEHVGDDGTTDENPIVLVHFVNTGFEPIRKSLRGKPTPDVGWYYVVYPDGYTSFSPGKAFDEGYKLIK